MAWTPLSERLSTLPLVLAGPILRRVEQDAVSVWIALREARELQLIVYDSQNQVVLQSPKQNTIALGTNLHILLLTAKLAPLSYPLAPDEVYSYSVFSHGADLAADAAVAFVPQGYTHPTFSLPPSSFGDLRVVHASCRKMHAPGEEAFVALHSMLETGAKKPVTFAQARPHQLFLTGDQIYADDVDGVQLFLIKDACEALLGWREDIEDYSGGLLTSPSFQNAAPGARAQLINGKSGFKFPLELDVPASHLMFLGEYYCMYLLMWSPVLWPAVRADYPTLEQVYYVQTANTFIPSEEEFVVSVNTAVAFQRDVALVRRALANVPTYMICDDHEITDDWFITMEWTRDVLASPLGRRILQNGLTAYALFQAWGNTPAQFETPHAGGYLLDIMPKWGPYGYNASDSTTGVFSYATSYWDSIYLLLGLPDLPQTISQRRLVPASPTIYLTYNYHIVWDKHEVIVLDTRNERAFASGDADPPILVSEQGLARQIDELADGVEVTFIVIATPISGIPNIEESLARARLVRGIYYTDGEVYAGQESALESLYGIIARRVSARQQRTNTPYPARLIVLSGDVHYGFTNRVEHWADRTYTDTEQTAHFPQTAHFVLAQLCASALKNEKGVINDDEKALWIFRSGTNKAHIEGYTPAELAGPKVTLGWVPPTNATKVVGTLHPVTNQGITTTRNLVITKKERVGNPYEIGEKNRSLPPQLSVQPDYTYRIDYIVAKGGTPRPESVLPEVAVDPALAPAGTALNRYLAVASNAQTYVLHDGYGREAVGKNNLGEIRFSWGFTEDTKLVLHQLWWRLVSRDMNSPELPPYPLSEYEVMLGASTTKYPKPTF